MNGTGQETILLDRPSESVSNVKIVPETTNSIVPNQIEVRINYTEKVYRFCKLHYPDIIYIARMLLDRARNQYDNQVAIEGVTGSGKSMFTLCLLCCMEHIQGRQVHLEKQVCFIPNEGQLKSALDGLKEGQAYWIDEAIRALDKKRWYNQDQIDLNHIVKTERYKHNTILYNIQRFSEFTESFRNGNIFFRIYIVPHYGAIVFASDIDKDTDDPWHIRENLSLKMRNKRKGQNVLMSPEDRYNMECRMPNHITHTLFPNLEKIPELEPFWRQYEAMKIASREIDRKEKLTTGGESKSMYKRKAVIMKLVTFILKSMKGMNLRKLHKAAGLDIHFQTLHDWMFDTQQFEILKGLKKDADALQEIEDTKTFIESNTLDVTSNIELNQGAKIVLEE